MKKLTFSFIIMFLSLVSLKAESFTLYYMPYSINVSQVIYVSNKTDTQYILKVKRIIDENQNIFLENEIITNLNAKTVTKIAKVLKDKLEEIGFNTQSYPAKKVKIEFEVIKKKITTNQDSGEEIITYTPAPKGSVNVHASYTIGGSDRGYVSTYLVDNTYLPYGPSAFQDLYIYNESGTDITSFDLEVFDDKGMVFNLTFSKPIKEGYFIKASGILNDGLIAKGFQGTKVLVVSKTEGLGFYAGYNVGGADRMTSMDPFNIGLTHSNTSSNSLKSTDVEAMPSGWTLAGTSSALDATDVLKSAKMGWIWKDGKWHVHSTADGFKDKIGSSSFDTFDTIPANSGFWIMK